MKYKSVAFIILFITGCYAQAQLKPKTVKKKKGNYSYAYHKNGKLSTEEFNPKSSTEKGYAKAFNNKGANIYKKETSRQHVVSSVQFTYHDNGTVKSAK